MIKIVSSNRYYTCWMLNFDGDYYAVPAHIRAEDHPLTKAAFALQAGFDEAACWLKSLGENDAVTLCCSQGKILDTADQERVQTALESFWMPHDNLSSIEAFCNGFAKVRLTKDEINFELPTADYKDWLGAVKGFLYDHPNYADRRIEIIYNYKVIHGYDNLELLEINSSQQL